VRAQEQQRRVRVGLQLRDLRIRSCAVAGQGFDAAGANAFRAQRQQHRAGAGGAGRHDPG
jgi:hypothetical protein